MDVLVISACSGDKRFDESPVGCAELDRWPRERLLDEYPTLVSPAAGMYTGREHGYVTSAVANFREEATVTWKIVSAGYGLLDEDDDIVSYDCTFNDDESVRRRIRRMGYHVDDLTKTETLQALAREKGIPADLQKTLDTGFDLVFVVLGKKYLVALAGALDDLPRGMGAYAIAAKGAKPFIGQAEWIPATEAVRSALGSDWFRIRGEL
ncbi:MAG: hypothetical protein R3324_14830, partial [Halobacteriales archaeon]|nr:hypothetical protein [Halobacteriales archaeon]